MSRITASESLLQTNKIVDRSSSITVFNNKSGLGESIALFLGEVTSFQITGTGNFSCSVSVSQDGSNFVAFDLSPATLSDIYMLDTYVNCFFKFELTINDGLVTVVLS